MNDLFTILGLVLGLFMFFSPERAWNFFVSPSHRMKKTHNWDTHSRIIGAFLIGGAMFVIVA
jgi:hypothetical protein